MMGNMNFVFKIALLESLILHYCVGSIQAHFFSAINVSHFVFLFMLHIIIIPGLCIATW